MRGYVYVGPFVCAASFLHRPCTSTSTQEQVVVDSTQTAACAFAAVAGIPIWRFGFPHKEAERLGGISSPKVGSGAGPNRGSVSLKGFPNIRGWSRFERRYALPANPKYKLKHTSSP